MCRRMWLRHAPRHRRSRQRGRRRPSTAPPPRTPRRRHRKTRVRRTRRPRPPQLALLSSSPKKSPQDQALSLPGRVGQFPITRTTYQAISAEPLVRISEVTWLREQGNFWWYFQEVHSDETKLELGSLGWRGTGGRGNIELSALLRPLPCAPRFSLGEPSADRLRVGAARRGSGARVPPTGAASWQDFRHRPGDAVAGVERSFPLRHLHRRAAYSTRFAWRTPGWTGSAEFHPARFQEQSFESD